MKYREEDRPIVFLLSLAIIGVFSYTVWQRVQSASTAGQDAHMMVRPVLSPDSTVAIQGEMRYLDDNLLDGSPRDADIIRHGDPFRPLPHPIRNADLRLLAGANPTVDPWSPLPPTAGAVPTNAASKPQKILATLEGVLNSDDVNAEAMLTFRDPGSRDPDSANGAPTERSVMVHIGDRLGAMTVLHITAEGIQLQGSGWWSIGQVRSIPHTRLLVQLISPNKVRSVRTSPASESIRQAQADSPEAPEVITHNVSDDDTTAASTERDQ